MQTTSAAAMTTSVDAPGSRLSARTSAGGMAATRRGPSAIAMVVAWWMVIGPRTRWLMIRDQAWASQNTKTETNRLSPIASTDGSARHWTATRLVTSSDP